MTQCIACGMPMSTPKDFAMSDTTKNYCRYCANADGSMQNFDQKLKSLTDFIVKTKGQDETSAKIEAQEMMKKLPAWKDNV